MDDVIDFLGGFLLGAAVGGAVGLLLAPQSGSGSAAEACASART